jgi:hypothetical protein
VDKGVASFMQACVVLLYHSVVEMGRSQPVTIRSSGGFRPHLDILVGRLIHDLYTEAIVSDFYDYPNAV